MLPSWGSQLGPRWLARLLWWIKSWHLFWSHSLPLDSPKATPDMSDIELAMTTQLQVYDYSLQLTGRDWVGMAI